MGARSALKAELIKFPIFELFDIVDFRVLSFKGSQHQFTNIYDIGIRKFDLEERHPFFLQYSVLNIRSKLSIVSGVQTTQPEIVDGRTCFGIPVCIAGEPETEISPQSG